MKLRTLRLHGFKSFADRTELEFRDGVTAVVGSNGCGKSNIADSIRWVLGEQRASAVRGSKMEEVIFQGTSRRRPLNFGEVSLVFSNEEGRVPIPQTEIEVARKVFREGGSEYALNRASCRLRDIHGVLRDTGLGSNAYAIIEAGMIETLLSDRAEERRALFEEAAGIGRYKDSRRSAARRLEAAEGDLSRLGDLVAEVESKVRSLARQKKRAQRHRELQERRLDLEVAIARSELAAAGDALAQGERRHSELEIEARGATTERSTAEALLEERRVETARLTRERSVVGERLESIRKRLDAREREVLLAEERRSNAEMRIEQLVRERGEVEQRRDAVTREMERLEVERSHAAGVLEGMRLRLEEQEEANQAVRSALSARRAESERLSARAREIAREIAGAEGDRDAAERRSRDLVERATRLRARQAELQGELDRVVEQTDLWSSEAERLRARVEAAAQLIEEVREEIRMVRGREDGVRERLRAAEDHLSRISAQLSARETMETAYEGFLPAVASIMSERSRFLGVRGPLADFIAPGSVDVTSLPALESYLGPLLQALVVEDRDTVRRLRRWFREEWTGGGTLILLPLDVLPSGGDPRTTSEDGGGAAWVRELMSGVEILDHSDPLESYAPGSARVGREGTVVDARGVVRLMDDEAGEGILRRREELQRLRAERARGEDERDALHGEREELLEILSAAEERSREAEEMRRIASLELQRVEAEISARAHRRERLERDRQEMEQSSHDLSRQQEESTASLALQAERVQALREEAEALGKRADAAEGVLRELESRWEDARDEEAELRVAVARSESELRELDRALAAARQSSSGAAHRLGVLEREAVELRSSLEGLSGLRQRAGEEIGALFLERDREAEALRSLDTRLSAIGEEAGVAGERVRVLRRREGEASEEKHRLELRNAELRAQLERVRDRLEAEWGRPWAALLDSAREVDEGAPALWREEVRETARQLEALGPVNMLALEEHEEEQRRLDFLLEQQADLTKARDDLAAAIRQINRTAREVFLETFDTVRENFRRTFQSLFQGGECDLWLADPDDPLESPVEIQASPAGKKTQRIHLLSGGERTLTALALLFALYLVKPSPFCVLDEVDAPLDESNVGRFIQLLHDFKRDTQFVVITHNTRTMEAADWVYGVTMEEPGVSKIVSVELEGTWALQDRVA